MTSMSVKRIKRNKSKNLKSDTLLMKKPVKSRTHYSNFEGYQGQVDHQDIGDKSEIVKDAQKISKISPK